MYLSSQGRTKVGMGMISLTLFYPKMLNSATWGSVFLIIIVLVTFTHVLQDGVEVRLGDWRTRYYTYHPDRALPYSREGCSKLQTVESDWITDDLEEDSDMAESVTVGALEAGDVPNIDDDNEYEDTVEYLTSGIRDILITGKVSELPEPLGTAYLTHISTDDRSTWRCMGPLHIDWPGEWRRVLIEKHELLNFKLYHSRSGRGMDCAFCSGPQYVFLLSQYSRRLSFRCF